MNNEKCPLPPAFQSPVSGPRSLSLYIHVPFCTAKCDYCDFFSMPLTAQPCCDAEFLLDAYAGRILADAQALLERYKPDFVPSVYIGGGTPSILGAERMDRLLAGLYSLLSIQDALSAGKPAGNLPLEISVELNPESACEEFLSVCRARGVSRVSMGVQSFYEPSRAAVRRNGLLSSAAIEKKLALVSEFFPGAFSVDLISGLPLQTQAILSDDLDRVLAFNPVHVSLYALSLEKGTVLEQNTRKQGSCAALPDTDEADSLWLSGRDRLLDAGYEQYEVSNFSLSGKQCLHNIRYWRMESWLGLGPGASGTIIDEDTGTAWRRTISPELEKWLAAPETCVREEFLAPAVLMRETLLMGFRYIKGPDPVLFRKRFGIDITDAIPKTLEHWQDSGCMAAGGIALNRKGLLLLDRFLVDAFVELDKNAGI